MNKTNIQQKVLLNNYMWLSKKMSKQKCDSDYEYKPVNLKSKAQSSKKYKICLNCNSKYVCG